MQLYRFKIKSPYGKRKMSPNYKNISIFTANKNGNVPNSVDFFRVIRHGYNLNNYIVSCNLNTEKCFVDFNH